MDNWETPTKWKGATMKKKLNMNLQFFAEPGSEPTGGQGEPAPQPGANQTPPATDPPQPQIDYNKIQQMLDGTLAAKENCIKSLL